MYPSQEPHLSVPKWEKVSREKKKQHAAKCFCNFGGTCFPVNISYPPPDARSSTRDFPCASPEPFTVPKLSLLLCAAPETFLAPGLELKNFRASFFQKRLPLFACTGDPHDPSAIHWARDFSSATATVLRCRVQGTSAAPAIHPVLPCFSVEGTSSTPAIHAVPPNNFCSDCSLSLIFIMPDVLDIQWFPGHHRKNDDSSPSHP